MSVQPKSSSIGNHATAGHARDDEELDGMNPTVRVRPTLRAAKTTIGASSTAIAARGKEKFSALSETGVCCGYNHQPDVRKRMSSNGCFHGISDTKASSARSSARVFCSKTSRLTLSIVSQARW